MVYLTSRKSFGHIIQLTSNTVHTQFPLMTGMFTAAILSVHKITYLKTVLFT